MEELFTHIVHPFVNHPEDLELNLIEGRASVLIEVKLHPEDLEQMDKEKTQAVLQILSLASGNKKPSIEYVSSFDEGGENTESSTEEEEAEVAAESDESADVAGEGSAEESASEATSDSEE